MMCVRHRMQSVAVPAVSRGTLVIMFRTVWAKGFSGCDLHALVALSSRLLPMDNPCLAGVLVRHQHFDVHACVRSPWQVAATFARDGQVRDFELTREAELKVLHKVCTCVCWYGCGDLCIDVCTQQ